MKKIIALALAAALLLSFTSCTKQNGTGTSSGALKGQPKNALEILAQVWSKYSADE